MIELGHTVVTVVTMLRSGRFQDFTGSTIGVRFKIDPIEVLLELLHLPLHIVLCDNSRISHLDLGVVKVTTEQSKKKQRDKSPVNKLKSFVDINEIEEDHDPHDIKSKEMN